MEPDEFRELHVRLPRQPLVNQRPWWIAGLVLAMAVLLIAAWSYYRHRKNSRLAGPKLPSTISYRFSGKELSEDDNFRGFICRSSP